METKFSEVAHLYMGCECKLIDVSEINEADIFSNPLRGDEVWTIQGVANGCLPFNGDEYDLCIKTTGKEYYTSYHNVKPILKHLSDITEEEFKEISIIIFGKEQLIPFADCKAKITEQGIRFFVLSRERFHTAPALFTYLLSKGYDLHNLLSTNQAINAK